VVLVVGEMGSGKTAFVRGACRALGVAGPVTSPTFTIGRRYAGTAGPIAHLDLHRLDSLDPGLLADYLEPGAVGFVEWPEVGEGVLAARATVAVTLRHARRDEREIEIER